MIDNTIDITSLSKHDDVSQNVKNEFVAPDGFDGCTNQEEMKMLDARYDERTRFIKSLNHFLKSLSDWYPNYGKSNNKIYKTLQDVAPYATRLYNAYAYNINEYAIFGTNTIKHISQNKKYYLEHVFNREEATEYDKMVAASVILHELIMWSENETYHDQCVEAIKEYYIDFFQKNKQYIINREDLYKWDDLEYESRCVDD